MNTVKPYNDTETLANIANGEKIAAELSKIDGRHWTLGENRDSQDGRLLALDLLGIAGEVVTMRADWRDKSRTNVDGGYPRSTDENGRDRDYGKEAKRYDEALPGISISASKSPKAAAADIARRFLPAYLELYKRACERKAAINAYIVSQHGLLDRLAAKCPNVGRAIKASDACKRGWNFSDPHIELGSLAIGWYGSAKVFGDGTTHIELRGIPEGVTAMILAALESFGFGEAPKTNP